MKRRRSTIQKPPAPLSEREIFELGLAPTRRVLSLVKGEMVIPTGRVPLGRLASVVAAHHGVTVEDMRGPRKFVRFFWARSELAWIAHRQRGISLNRVGAFLNQADHTSALNGMRAHEARLFEIETGKALAA